MKFKTLSMLLFLSSAKSFSSCGCQTYAIKAKSSEFSKKVKSPQNDGFFCHVCYHVYLSSFFRLTNIIILQFFPHMFFPLSVMRICITISNLAKIVLLLRHFACEFESKCHVCYHGIALLCFPPDVACSIS